MLLDERIRADGSHARTWATWSPDDSDRLHIREDGGEGGAGGRLSLLAVDRVMRRYGRPLEPGVALEGESLTCGVYRLRRLRYHAAVDAEGRDYLVWEAPDGEPVACIAAMVTSALRYLVARLTDELSQESET